tara:strand:+ start:6651 stop:11768 length:5118 start_codon:yes stop_codon:yes gene_type:complete
MIKVDYNYAYFILTSNLTNIIPVIKIDTDLYLSTIAIAIGDGKKTYPLLKGFPLIDKKVDFQKSKVTSGGLSFNVDNSIISGFSFDALLKKHTSFLSSSGIKLTGLSIELFYAVPVVQNDYDPEMEASNPDDAGLKAGSYKSYTLLESHYKGTIQSIKVKNKICSIQAVDGLNVDQKGGMVPYNPDYASAYGVDLKDVPLGKNQERKYSIEDLNIFDQYYIEDPSNLINIKYWDSEASDYFHIKPFMDINYLKYDLPQEVLAVIYDLGLYPSDALNVGAQQYVWNGRFVDLGYEGSDFTNHIATANAVEVHRVVYPEYNELKIGKEHNYYERRTYLPLTPTAHTSTEPDWVMRSVFDLTGAEGVGLSTIVPGTLANINSGQGALEVRGAECRMLYNNAGSGMGDPAVWEMFNISFGFVMPPQNSVSGWDNSCLIPLVKYQMHMKQVTKAFYTEYGGTLENKWHHTSPEEYGGIHIGGILNSLPYDEDVLSNHGLNPENLFHIQGSSDDVQTGQLKAINCGQDADTNTTGATATASWNEGNYPEINCNNVIQDAEMDDYLTLFPNNTERYRIYDEYTQPGSFFLEEQAGFGQESSGNKVSRFQLGMLYYSENINFPDGEITREAMGKGSIVANFDADVHYMGYLQTFPATLNDKILVADIKEGRKDDSSLYSSSNLLPFIIKDIAKNEAGRQTGSNMFWGNGSDADIQKMKKVFELWKLLGSSNIPPVNDLYSTMLGDYSYVLYEQRPYKEEIEKLLKYTPGFIAYEGDEIRFKYILPLYGINSHQGSYGNISSTYFEDLVDYFKISASDVISMDFEKTPIEKVISNVTYDYRWRQAQETYTRSGSYDIKEAYDSSLELASDSWDDIKFDTINDHQNNYPRISFLVTEGEGTLNFKDLEMDKFIFGMKPGNNDSQYQPPQWNNGHTHLCGFTVYMDNGEALTSFIYNGRSGNDTDYYSPFPSYNNPFGYYLEGETTTAFGLTSDGGWHWMQNDDRYNNPLDPNDPMYSIDLAQVVRIDIHDVWYANTFGSDGQRFYRSNDRLQGNRRMSQVGYADDEDPSHRNCYEKILSYSANDYYNWNSAFSNGATFTATRLTDEEVVEWEDEYYYEDTEPEDDGEGTGDDTTGDDQDDVQEDYEGEEFEDFDPGEDWDHYEEPADEGENLFEFTDGAWYRYTNYYPKEELHEHIEIPFTDSPETARFIARNYVHRKCNPDTVIKLTLPMKYSLIEVGDVLWFDGLVKNEKMFDMDYSFWGYVKDLSTYYGFENDTFENVLNYVENGQLVTPFFIVSKTENYGNQIKMEAIQARHYTGLQAIDPFSVQNQGSDFLKFYPNVLQHLGEPPDSNEIALEFEPGDGGETPDLVEDYVEEYNLNNEGALLGCFSSEPMILNMTLNTFVENTSDYSEASPVLYDQLANSTESIDKFLRFPSQTSDLFRMTSGSASNYNDHYVGEFELGNLGMGYLNNWQQFGHLYGLFFASIYWCLQPEGFPTFEELGEMCIAEGSGIINNDFKKTALVITTPSTQIFYELVPNYSHENGEAFDSLQVRTIQDGEDIVWAIYEYDALSTNNFQPISVKYVYDGSGDYVDFTNANSDNADNFTAIVDHFYNIPLESGQSIEFKNCTTLNLFAVSTFVGEDIIITYTEQPEAEVLVGDINADGIVNILDVVILINMVLGNIEADIATGDISGDGIINILDVVQLMTIVLEQ